MGTSLKSHLAQIFHNPATLAAHQQSVEKAIHCMRCNLADDWNADLSLEALCREVGYSKSHFIGIFEEITGTTPHHFLASLRIQRSKELLLTTKRSVTEISLEVGYDSFPTFSRTFSAYVGHSPSEFRKLPTEISPNQLSMAAKLFIVRNQVRAMDPVVEGRVVGPNTPGGINFVGTFTRGVPQGVPHSGTVVLGDGVFQILKPPGPMCHLLAAHVSLPSSGLMLAHSLMVNWVAAHRFAPDGPRFVQLKLRPIRITDPPLVVSLSALLQK